jgi:uridine kinase
VAAAAGNARGGGAGGLVVGLAGGSASGKTTFVSTLAPILEKGPPPLRVEILSMDRYFYRGAENGPTFVSPSTGEVRPDNNHPDSADNARLCADLDARRSAPDAPDVLIVEGLMALHVPAVRERLDLRLFLELDADERALRRLLRDTGAGPRGGGDPQFVATYYRECARVGHARYVEPSRVHADLILRGDADFGRIAPLVAAVIRDRAGREGAPR